MENKYLGIDVLEKTMKNIIDSILELMKQSDVLRIYLNNALIEIIVTKEKPIVYEVENNICIDFIDSEEYFSFKWKSVEYIEYLSNGQRKRVFR